ncbi:glucosidase II beta subunit-like-domain-containing protein, partial [Coemansia spiralis]
LRGVDPARAHHYQPNAQGNFQCLDKSLDIPFAQVNDDYCDCPDGSDEPGTSACNNATFYCANRGHIPGRLSSTRVNDGVCDYDVCCDGSDEWESSICPDRCAEMGSEHRRKAMEMERVQRAGSQKRMELIREAKELRQAKTKELAQKDSELAELTAKVENAEKRKLELEEKQRQQMDRDNEAQDDISVDACKTAIEIFENELETLNDDINMLFGILDKLRTGYDKNYHDLAVKAADVGLREFEEARKSDLAEIAEHQESNKIDTLRLRVQEAMAKHGELGTSNSSEDHDENGGNDSQLAEQLASARTEFWDLQSSLTRLNNEVSQLRELLERDLGPDDMYLAAKGACYSLDAGEYTYELCLLDRASQISKKDGSRQGLGSFDGFGDDSLDYTVLRFAHGTKCWNGPERSITASFTCAEEIKVVSVSEPEKCEYSAKMTGPFAC